MHHVVNVVLIAHKVDAQQAGVAVGRVEGLEAVAQVVLHRQASQTAAQVLRERGKTTVEVKGLSMETHREIWLKIFRLTGYKLTDLERDYLL